MYTLDSVVKNPSGYDSHANYIGPTEFPGLLVVLTRIRDEECLGQANWESAFAMLGGKETDDVVIHRFGHWACGWWEALCVREGSEAHTIALDIENRLVGYPVLDDETLSWLEQEKANDVWRTCYSWKDRIEYIRKHPDQFEPRSLAGLLACVRGEYFLGYASELIY
jgi:hypothetical protein